MKSVPSQGGRVGKMKWLVADIEHGVLSAHRTKREAVKALKATTDSKLYSEKVGAGFYRYDAGKYVVRRDVLRTWNLQMLLAWVDGRPYRRNLNLA